MGQHFHNQTSEKFQEIHHNRGFINHQQNNQNVFNPNQIPNQIVKNSFIVQS